MRQGVCDECKYNQIDYNKFNRAFIKLYEKQGKEQMEEQFKTDKVKIKAFLDENLRAINKSIEYSVKHNSFNKIINFVGLLKKFEQYTSLVTSLEMCCQLDFHEEVFELFQDFIKKIQIIQNQKKDYHFLSDINLVDFESILYIQAKYMDKGKLVYGVIKNELIQLTTVMQVKYGKVPQNYKYH